jgi:hypothetical protein
MRVRDHCTPEVEVAGKSGIRMRSGAWVRLCVQVKKVKAKGSEWECGMIAG